MTDEAPQRSVRRVRDEDLDGWQRDILEESRRRIREERAFADGARSEAAAQRSGETSGSGIGQSEDR